MNLQTLSFIQASAQSFKHQGNKLTVQAADKLHGILEIPLGFQPLGISSVDIGGRDQIAIAAYYQPAVCLAEVTRDVAGLHFEISYMRGAQNGISSARGGFSDILPESGANRCVCAFFYQGRLWVNRGDRDFFILESPETLGERWKLVDKVSLPLPQRGWRDVHSATIHKDKLVTVEANGKLDKWEIHYYPLPLPKENLGEVNQLEEMWHVSAPWHYGISFGKCKGDRKVVTITDFKASETGKPLGIYFGGQCILSCDSLSGGGLWGNGICPLSDGGALVTRHGESNPHPFGIPGALIYIPAQYFSGFTWIR